MDDESLDDDRLRAVMLEGARADFAEIARRLAGEHVYAIGLYTTGGREHVAPTVSTDEGLERVVAVYAAEQPRTSLEVHRLELRDSCADSPHHGWASELPGLRRASELVAGRSRHVFSLFRQASERGEDAHAIADAWDGRTDEVMLSVLEALDREGAFGTGEARERVVVNLYRGDQDERERLAFSERLNPASAHARYAEHWKKLGVTR